MSETTPQPNIPLLRKMVEWVEEQETLTENREWHQGSWLRMGRHMEGFKDINWCETACCVAGKVALLEGYKPEVIEYDGVLAYSGEVIDSEGYIHDTETVAMETLGIDAFQAMGLFQAGNDAADIRRIAEQIAGESL